MKKQIIGLLTLSLAGLTSLNAATTQAEQAAMSPQDVLNHLMEGNERFQSGLATQRNYLQEAAQTAGGQYPMEDFHELLSAGDTKYHYPLLS